MKEMGNSGGLLKQWTDSDRTDPRRTNIISEELEHAAELLTNNKRIQELFLVYFLSGVWVEKFMDDKGRITWDIFVEKTSQVGQSVIVTESKIDNRRKSFKEEASLACENDDVSCGPRYRTAFAKLLQDTNINSLLLLCAFPYFMQSKRDEVTTESPRGTFTLSLASIGRRKGPLDEDSVSVATERTMWSMSFHIVGDKSSRRTVCLSSPGRPIATPNSMYASFTRCMKASLLQPMIVDRLSKIRCVSIYQLLSNGSSLWLAQLLRFLLDLPYAISIAAVLPSKGPANICREHSYPMIYANYAYEHLMQFKHSDLEGFAVNCLFDSSVAGDETVEAFEISLEEMKPFQTGMKMVRRSGEVVDTWLATCPVFSVAQNAYTHIVLAHHLMTSQTVVSEVATDMEALLCLVSALFH